MKNYIFRLFIPLFTILLFFGVFVKASYAVNCSPPISGNYTVSTSCSFANTVDGVDAGTGTTNTAVMTIPNGVTLTVGSIANQIIGYGSIALADGATIIINKGVGALLKKSPIWIQDADADGYPAIANPTGVLQNNQPANYSRRNLMTTLSSADCNDSNPGPCPPTGFSTTAASSNQINLSWTAPSTSIGPAATGYDVYYCSGISCSPTTSLVSNQAGVTYSHTGLVTNTVYGYYAVARNAAGVSASSGTSYATTWPLCNSGVSCGSCSVSCGGGTQTCTYTTYSGGGSCTQNSYSQSCNTQACCTNVYCYTDSDGDSYGTGSQTLYCTSNGLCPAGTSASSGDCCDSDSGSKPGATACKTSASACGWDWDCSGAIDYCDGTLYPSGGSAAQSYHNGAVCTNGNYSPLVSASSTQMGCGQTGFYNCAYTYYSSSGCAGGVTGRGSCTTRLTSCH